MTAADTSDEGVIVLNYIKSLDLEANNANMMTTLGISFLRILEKENKKPKLEN